MKPNQETAKTNLERSAYVTNNLLLLSLVVGSQMTEKATKTATAAATTTATTTTAPTKTHHCGKRTGIAIILHVVLVCRMKSCVEFSLYFLEVPDFKQHNTPEECIVVVVVVVVIVAVVVVVVNNKRQTHHANPLAPSDARAQERLKEETQSQGRFYGNASSGS